MPSDINEKIIEALFRQSLASCASALAQASERLQPAPLHHAICCLLECSGKVIVCGVGKSGIIANKIASTLTSTGTPAIPLHPCDALHGDIGIVTPGDVVIMISNSGRTEELMTILPHITHREVTTIAIVGNMKSALAERVHVAIDASVDREACHLNLAPTTSTTVALAIGDAIATTLMYLKNVTAETFALNHPAGHLGKRLTLRVGDLMHTHASIGTVGPDAAWIEIISTIGTTGLGAVNIVDKSRKLLGLITDGDIRRTIRDTPVTQLADLTASDIMTKSPIVVGPDALAIEALRKMEERESQISVLPVVGKAHICLGLVRLHDIIRSGL